MAVPWSKQVRPECLLAWVVDRDAAISVRLMLW